MKSKQQADREEQQRIKNLVLNYDLRDGEDQDGDDFSLNPIVPNYNIKTLDTGLERLNVASNAKLDKSGNNRSGHRARKLQLSDVDWYGKNSPKTSEKKGGDKKSASDGSAALSTSVSSGASGISMSTAVEKDAPVYGLKDAPNSRPNPTTRNGPAQRGKGGGGMRGRGRGRAQPQWTTRRPTNLFSQENQKKANDGPIDGI